MSLKLGERLKIFIDICYPNQVNFADYCKINSNLITRYITHRNVPHVDTLQVFFEAGVSIDWLLSGSGSMFANNKTGNHLRQKYLQGDFSAMDTNISRVQQWIEINYTSLQNFSLTMDYDYIALSQFFENRQILDLKFSNLLIKAGCNLNWILTGNGDMFANNLCGDMLRDLWKKRHEKGNEQDINQTTPAFPYDEFMQAMRMVSSIMNIKQEKNNEIKN